MVKKDKYIFLITGEFETFHRKVMIEEFAKYIYPQKVIIVNRPFDLISYFFKNKKVKKSYSYKNIHVLNTYLILHDQISLKLAPILKKLNFFKFKQDIKNITKENENNIIWIMHPDLNDYLLFIDNKKIVYDCYDEFFVKNAIKKIENRENYLVEKSDLVITSSKYLKENKENIYKTNNFFHSATAVNIDLFKNLKNDKPKDLENINGKIIGFAGSIRDDLDIEAIKYIAKNQNNSLVFIGTISSENVFNQLKDIKNIYFLGKKSFSDFINYLNYFDVAIMPHILNDFIKSSSPYKFYQYLAANLYVVSSPIPEIIDFEKSGSNFVKIAYNKEEFLEYIYYFLSKPKIKLNEEELYSISWQNRFENIFKELEKRNII